jgi:hypothetical protein
MCPIPYSASLCPIAAVLSNVSESLWDATNTAVPIGFRQSQCFSQDMFGQGVVFKFVRWHPAQQLPPHLELVSEKMWCASHGML